jgi:phage portal protein BeeE
MVRANIDALVRVDLATRYRAHDSALRAGWKSRNEVRDLEDMSPIDGGDEFLWPPYRTFPLEKDEAE